jgi:hypothetical protein
VCVVPSAVIVVQVNGVPVKAFVVSDAQMTIKGTWIVRPESPAASAHALFVFSSPSHHSTGQRCACEGFRGQRCADDHHDT